MVGPNMRSKKATLIHHFLETSAHSYPDKTAIIYDQVRASYSEINKSADQLAGWLIRAGIELGDRVVLIMDNCLEYIVGYYGALKSGAVVASLSSDLKPDGLVPMLRELEPKIIISSWKFERLLQATHLEVSEETALLLKPHSLRVRTSDHTGPSQPPRNRIGKTSEVFLGHHAATVRLPFGEHLPDPPIDGSIKPGVGNHHDKRHRRDCGRGTYQ